MKDRLPFMLMVLMATIALLISACVAPVEPAATQSENDAPPAAQAGGQLSEEQLKNATYSGIYDEAVTLVDGIYEGEPFVEGGASRPMVTYVENSSTAVDMNADGQGDGVALLAENSGGSGVFTYAGAQINQDGKPVDAGTVLLGDRVQIISTTAVNNQVAIDMVTVGPNDAMCCATLKVRKTLGLDGNMLAEISTEELGTVSLDDLMNTDWVLYQLDRGQPVEPEPPITATFADGQISGSGGCNSYNGSVTSDAGQNLSVGPLISTQMACPTPIMDQELTYLSSLQGAFQWSYQVGQLAITYRRADESVGSMLFNPGNQAQTASTDSEMINITYQCADNVNLDVVYDNANESVTVALPDGTVELPRAEAASGARYSDGTTTFWSKGDEAFVEINDETVYRDCVAQQ